MFYAEAVGFWTLSETLGISERVCRGRSWRATEEWVWDRSLARDCHDDLILAILDLLVAEVTSEHSKGWHLRVGRRQNHDIQLPALVWICG